MTAGFEKKLDLLTAHKINRTQFAQEILNQKELFPVLIHYCFESSDKIGVKALWTLEMVCYEKLDWLTDYLTVFCSKIKYLSAKSAIRPASKICLLLTIAQFKNKQMLLTENHLQLITEICFDWLINDSKTATKCYSIRTLYLLGKHYSWIHPELKVTLTKDYKSHSPAYRAVAREILKKIK